MGAVCSRVHCEQVGPAVRSVLWGFDGEDGRADARDEFLALCSQGLHVIVGHDDPQISVAPLVVSIATHRTMKPGGSYTTIPL